MEMRTAFECNSDIAVVEAGVDACSETALSGLSAEELSDRLVALTRVTAKLAALRVDVVDQAEYIDIGELSDQRNAANHLASVTAVDPADVRADALLGRWLRDFAVFREAFEAGTLTAAHLDILRKADNVRVHSQMVDDQECLVVYFTSVHFRDLGEVMDRWLLGADPDGAEPKVHEQKVGLSITPLPGGMAKISGILDPLQAAALRDSVNAEANKIRREHQEQDIASTNRQRMVTALLNLVGRGAARQDGTFAKPRVNIVMSQDVFEDTAAWLEDQTEPFPEIDPLGRDHDKKCQLIDGTPIHPLYGFAAAAIGVMRRHVYGAKDRPINVSSDARKVPDWMQETQLIATNGKCSNPVCDAPFSWMHADHIQPHSRGGETSVKNTRPLCEPDNLWRGNDASRGIWHD